MLRRNSSKLYNRKSASSTHSKHEFIDPEIARQHAHTAATLAFARAQERHSAELGDRVGGLLRSNTSTSRQGQQRSAQVHETPSNVVRRQHSVRFVGPNIVQRRQTLSARPVGNHTMPSASPVSLRPMAITTNDPVPAVYRPPSRSSSIGKASTGKGTADSYVTALAAYNEYYMQEDDIASTPSSYRRIRRSKSMFSPLKAPNVFYTNGTPERLVDIYRNGEQSIATSQTPLIDSSGIALKAPRSMSFLRGGHEYLTPGLRERNDEAVQLARDRFFHQATQQRLREQPYHLFKSKVQRQEKPFRQTVRSSSANSCVLPIASANQVQPQESRLKDKARRASKTIKNKFRRAFGRSTQNPVEIPNQQVNASQTHVRKYPSDSRDIDRNLNNIHFPNQMTFQRVALRPPSLQPTNSSEQLRSDASSVKSTKSDHSDEGSRVTSWNSTGVNTLASQGVKNLSERDAQRLSVINENGTHVPSSSFDRAKLSNQFSAYPLIHRSNKSVGNLPAFPYRPIDSARVYSALMKRLDENSPKAKLEAAQTQSQESPSAQKRIPSRTSSVHDIRDNGTPATIRQVAESNQNSDENRSIDHEHHWIKADSVHSARAEDVFGYSGTHIHQWAAADSLRGARMRDQDDVFSSKSAPHNRNNISDRKENVAIDLPVDRSGSVVTQEASIRTSYHTVPEDIDLTPQELAARNEPVLRGSKILRETKSTFFGGTGFTICRTTSPFRRALAGADYNATALNSGISMSLNHFPILTPQHDRTKSANVAEFGDREHQEADKSYSESVYSRTTSGQAPRAASNSSLLPVAGSETREIPIQGTCTGDIVILNRATYQPTMPGTKGHRVTSSASSTEWKNWMSSEVAKLERVKDDTSSRSYVNYALPTMPKSFHAGHVRESAQINDDETDIAQRMFSAAKQPLGIVQQNMNTQNIQQMGLHNQPLLKPILKNRSTVSLVENVDSYNTYKSTIPVPPPPSPLSLVPPRSPLRAKQSKSSLLSVRTINTFNTPSAPNSAAKISSVNGQNLLHERNTSQTTFRSEKSLNTPAKLVKRNGRKLSNASHTPGPGDLLNAVLEKQFGSVSTRSRTPGANWSANREKCTSQQDDFYWTDGAGLTVPMMSGGVQELDAQQMGSKRMVELFLSSRRRKIAGGSEESGVFI